MKYIVTMTTTDLITNAQRVQTTAFGDYDHAASHMEWMRRKLWEKEIISENYLDEGDGYIIEYAPKMQVVIEISVVD